MGDGQKPDSSKPNFLEMLKGALKTQGALHTSTDRDPEKKDEDNKQGGTATAAGDTAENLTASSDAQSLLNKLLDLPRK